MRSCVLKINKQIGPYMKSLIGPWIAGINDTHPATAKSAELAFNAVFSPVKQIEAIKFGLKSIVKVFNV